MVHYGMTKTAQLVVARSRRSVVSMKRRWRIFPQCANLIVDVCSPTASRPTAPRYAWTAAS